MTKMNSRTVELTCKRCGNPFQGHRRGRRPKFCARCRQKLRGKAKQSIFQQAPNPARIRRNMGYPALENGHPVLSLGWFKINIAKGHTAQSLADLTGLDIRRIRAEMSCIRSAKHLKNLPEPYPYVLSGGVRQMPAKSRFKNPNLGMLKGMA